MSNLLDSRFVIDGVSKEFTPSQILGGDPPCEDSPVVYDETIDPEPGSPEVSPAKLKEYLALLSSAERTFPLPFASDFTAAKLASALIDSIWRQGNVRLEDMPVTLKWTWNTDKLGNASAFYNSVEAVADYAQGLGLSLRRHSCQEGPADLKIATPFTGAPVLLPAKLQNDPQSWIIYIPFETSEYKLGASLLCQQLGCGAGIAPQMSDPDYFLDCYELVREMVEDGVALSGCTVGDGGLLYAVQKMCSDHVGAQLDLSDILKAGEKRELVRVCFAEVPGVLIQVRNYDFDYIDAECLLQDIAFYPLGHPVPGSSDIRVKASSKSGIQQILESLIQNAEGED